MRYPVLCIDGAIVESAPSHGTALLKKTADAIRRLVMAGGETFLTTAEGDTVGAAHPLPVSGANVFSTDVTVHDPVTVGQKLKIDAAGRVAVTKWQALASTGQPVTGTNGAAAQVIIANAARTFIRITNVSIHTVYIGATSGVTAATGQAIPSGASQDFPTTGALYVASVNTGDKVTFAEFTG